MSKKEDEVLAQLEAIMKELKESKQQTATTLAVNNKAGSLNFRHIFKLLFQAWRFRISILFILLMLVGIVIGVGAFYYFSGTKAYTEKGSIVEQMREMSSLATSQAYVKAVIEKEDNQLFGKEISKNFPGTKRKLLLIVPGTVTAGIDLEGISEHDVSIWEEEKRIELTLPPAEILQEPSLDFDKVQTFSVEGIFREEVKWEEAYGLATEAKEQVLEEAVAQGLLKMAEANAEKSLKQFFAQLGYELTVRYKE